MSEIKMLDDGNFSAEVESQSSGAVIVDFYADWCGPCQIMGPQIERLAAKYSGRATVAKFDVDQSISVPTRFGIQGIPTVLLFKGGKLVDRVVGLVPGEELKRRLDLLIDGGKIVNAED
ncbi:MAG: thioredoxin [Gemmatimonadota bacterium]|nr:thioredoxin [Gemmatimonadota bacterium]